MSSQIVDSRPPKMFGLSFATRKIGAWNSTQKCFALPSKILRIAFGDWTDRNVNDARVCLALVDLVDCVNRWRNVASGSMPNMIKGR